MLVGIGKEVTAAKINRMRIKKCVHTVVVLPVQARAWLPPGRAAGEKLLLIWAPEWLLGFEWQ